MHQEHNQKLLEKEVTLLDIKSKFCNAWEKRFLDIKSSKKEERAIFDKITQCAILSNTNNDDIPIIHIRFDMSEIDYSTVTEFIDTIVDKFKLKGIEEINIKLTPLNSKDEGNTEYYAEIRFIFNDDFEYGTTTKIDEFKLKFSKR